MIHPHKFFNKNLIGQDAKLKIKIINIMPIYEFMRMIRIKINKLNSYSHVLDIISL